MKDLKRYSDEEIVKLIQAGKVSVNDFLDSGICPTCFDRTHNHVLYGDNTDKMIYEDDRFACFLVGNPRTHGHAAISAKKHFKDMMEADDETIRDIFVLAKKLMKAIKETYHTESVYLCTMCDGLMNHFHVQLIPRYAHEVRGSTNFVKPRFTYVENLDQLNQLRELMKQ